MVSVTSVIDVKHWPAHINSHQTGYQVKKITNDLETRRGNVMAGPGLAGWGADGKQWPLYSTVLVLLLSVRILHKCYNSYTTVSLRQADDNLIM